MALSELERFDLAYMTEQAAAASRVAAAVLAAWMALVDEDDISGSGPAWLDAAVELILAGRRRSGQIANAYSLTVRRFMIPEAPLWTPSALDEPNLEQIRKSLAYQGLANAAVKLEKIPNRQSASTQSADFWAEQASNASIDKMREEVKEKAGVQAAAASYRHVRNGGRDAILSALGSDSRAKAYVRITDGDPCYFCAMLASRGAVYREDSFRRSNAQRTGAGTEKVHDDCGCDLRLIYRDDDSELPENSIRFADLWTETGAKFSGDAAVKEFRRHYEGRSQGPRYRVRSAS